MLVLAVLSQLTKQQYGYALLKLLADQGMQIDQGTLYPLLRRLEIAGFAAVQLERGRGGQAAALLRGQRRGAQAAGPPEK